MNKCECGCGADVNNRFVSGHNGRKSPVEYIETDDGCWEWQRAINSGGYGQKWHGGRVRTAHRLYYEMYVGPIPEGKSLDHLCRNRKCVNPDHLEPVTNAENCRRGARATLSRATRDFIRNQRGKTTQTKLAAQLGISQTAVSQIQRGARWANEATPSAS